MPHRSGSSADFVVIGGGIAGASAAYELAGRGSVVLVEREQTAGYHTTGRSAAIFTESYERGAVRALTMAGRAFFEDPPQGFTDTPLLSPLPVLLIGRDDQRPRLDEMYDAAASLVRVEKVDRGGLTSLCPALRTATVAAGVLDPGAMEIDVHALHQGFLGGISRRGSRVLTNCGVVALEANAAGWNVRTGNQILQTGVVVNAAGAWCDAIAEMAGLDPVGLQPYRRTAFTFGPEDHDVSAWPIVVDIDADFYFKPERTQLMGSLAEETPMPPHDARAEEIDVALAIDRITLATTFEIRHVHRTWAGLRTFAADRLPVVGFDPDAPGFFWLSGQGGFGIMTSPALGRTAAALICEGEVPTDVAERGVTPGAISPARFR